MLTRPFRLLTPLLLAAAAAFAGGDLASGSACENQCPLAQRANHRLATGHEAAQASPTVRADIVKRVLDDLESI